MPFTEEILANFFSSPGKLDRLMAGNVRDGAMMNAWCLQDLKNQIVGHLNTFNPTATGGVKVTRRVTLLYMLELFNG